MSVVLAAAAIGAGVLSALRWLRVAQREHYHAGSVMRFARRWWRLLPNLALGLAVLAGATLSGTVRAVAPIGAVVALGGVAAGPFGLGLRGRTGEIAWTARARRVAGAVSIPLIAGAAWTVFAGTAAPAVWAAVLVPVWTDLALLALAPLERRLGNAWVERAAAAIRDGDVRVVAVTGSFGKTTTKGYIAHLLSAVTTVLASPASFNNRMGLARAVNEHLTSGIDVFVAEMGTYGRGEIADLCSWIPPDVGVITALGPVHLERMGTEETIADAKREILDRAATGVVNVDHPLLRRVAEEEAARIRIVTCSSRDPEADVFADPETGEVTVDGAKTGRFDPASAHAGGVACAVAAAVALGVDPAEVSERLSSLPTAPHRRAVGTSERGFVVVDDTFNANPEGARAALDVLARSGDPGGRRVLVTPGMVELGSRQFEENLALARAAGAVASDIVVVGRTNRRALVSGAAKSGLHVVIVPSREAAVAWVRGVLGPGDAVLYENDLPDHYP